MARGWESKAVESQIEAAEARAERSRVNEIQAADLSRRRERESLELSRTRVLQDLEKATNPRYQDMLNQSLRFLDEKIAALEPPALPQTARKHHA